MYKSACVAKGERGESLLGVLGLSLSFAANASLCDYLTDLTVIAFYPKRFPLRLASSSAE